MIFLNEIQIYMKYSIFQNMQLSACLNILMLEDQFFENYAVRLDQSLLAKLHHEALARTLPLPVGRLKSLILPLNKI